MMGDEISEGKQRGGEGRSEVERVDRVGDGRKRVVKHDKCARRLATGRKIFGVFCGRVEIRQHSVGPGGGCNTGRNIQINGR